MEPIKLVRILKTKRKTMLTFNNELNSLLVHVDPVCARADTGGRIQGGGGTFAPPEFGIFCSDFQNCFSIACLRERNPSAKQEKYLS